ncbi:MAG TPA: sugar phosphate isomerase/epimerase [Naasia sp.]|jgi:sugar phosphate isomerase/epimerase
MTSPTLSVQLYSVREAIAADLRSALERVAELGFRQVELFGFADRAEEYAALLPQLGLTAPSAHGAILGEDSRRTFAAARRIGVGTVLLPWVEPERWADEAAAVALAEELNGVVQSAADHGLRVGYHNHDFEFAAGTGPFDAFVERLDERAVLEIDTYWVAVAGQDPAELLRRLGDRVALIHVKDGPLDGGTAAQLPAGQGSVDVPGILAAAPDALRVVEFDDYSGDVFDGLRQSVEFLTGRGEAL